MEKGKGRVSNEMVFLFWFLLVNTKVYSRGKQNHIMIDGRLSKTNRVAQFFYAAAQEKRQRGMFSFGINIIEYSSSYLGMYEVGCILFFFLSFL